jgi:hypothetical protein
MSHDDGTWDPGHGEPGHVHDEAWNGRMMATDDPADGEILRTDGTVAEVENVGAADYVETPRV